MKYKSIVICKLCFFLTVIINSAFCFWTNYISLSTILINLTFALADKYLIRRTVIGWMPAICKLWAKMIWKPTTSWLFLMVQPLSITFRLISMQFNIELKNSNLLQKKIVK